MGWRDNAKVVIVFFFCFVLNENENISRMLWNDSSKTSEWYQCVNWAMISVFNQERSRGESQSDGGWETECRGREGAQKGSASNVFSIIKSNDFRWKQLKKMIWFVFGAIVQREKIDKNLRLPLRPINIKRVKYLIKLREIILFLLVEAVCCYFVVDLFSLFFFCVFLLFSLHSKTNYLCGSGQWCWFRLLFFLSHSSAFVSYWVGLCTSLDYEIHTLRIGSKRNNRTWKHIFQIPDQRGPCSYLYLSVCACLALRSLSRSDRRRLIVLTRSPARWLALCAHTFSHTKFLCLMLFPPIEFGALNAYIGITGSHNNASNRMHK